MSIKQRCRYLCFFSVAGPAVLVVLLGCPLVAPAQVAINMDGSLPHSSAMLDLKSVMGGVLIPRMTTAERTGIASPATGLLVFDTNTNTFWYYNGTQWETISRRFPSSHPGGRHTGVADGYGAQLPPNRLKSSAVPLLCGFPATTAYK